MFRARTNESLSQNQVDFLSSSEEPTSDIHLSERSKLIQKHSKSVPDKYKKYWYDAVFVFCQKDRESVFIYISQLSKRKLTSKHSVKTVLYDDLKTNNPSIENSFSDSHERSFFIFLYVTEYFCQEADGWDKFANEKWIKEAIRNKKCTLINFSRKTLPLELQRLHTITNNGNYDEDFNQICELLKPTAKARIAKNKECEKEIWYWMNKNILHSSSSSDDDVTQANKNAHAPPQPESGIGESLQSYDKESNCSQNGSFASNRNRVGQYDENAAFGSYHHDYPDFSSGFISGGTQDSSIGIGRRVNESNVRHQKYSDKESSYSGRISTHDRSVTLTGVDGSMGQFSQKDWECKKHQNKVPEYSSFYYEKSTTINIITKDTRMSLVRKGKSVAHGQSKCKGKTKGKDKGETNFSSPSYDRSQQIMVGKQKNKEQQYRSNDDVPFGIQESCSPHQENNPPSFLVNEHQSPFREKAFDGSQQQKPEKYSGKVEVSSASESLKRKSSPQNTDDTKTGLRRPISASEFSDNQESSTQTISGLENPKADIDHEFRDIPMNHVINDAIFCDRDMEKEPCNISKGLCLMTLLSSKDIQSDSFEQNTSQRTSRQSSTNEESNYSGNEEPFENDFSKSMN